MPTDSAWLLLAIACLGREPQVLEPGDAVEGFFGDARLAAVDVAEVRTERLDALALDGAPIGRRYGLEVEETGVYRVELSSYFFDAYLVLRDADGEVLAEDDDGLLSEHARLVVELEAYEPYLVDACALHGDRGAYELRLLAGPPQPITAEARAEAELEDAQARLVAVEGSTSARGMARTGVLDDLALGLHERGRLREARPLLERSLAITEETLGPDHEATAASLNNLAILYKDLGNYEAARPLYERALAVLERAVGPEHPNTARALNNLGALLRDLGDYEAARPLVERALAVMERTLGPEDAATAACMNNLGTLLAELGEFEAARPLYERSLRVRERTLGPEHRDTALALTSLGNLLFELGDYDAARPLVERSLAIWEKALGPEHSRTATAANNLGALLRELGEYEAARPLVERAVAVFELSLGADHSRTATALSNLGELLRDLGDYEAARPLFERSLAVREATLGAEHSATATAANDLGLLCLELGEFAAARTLLERALTIREKALGPEHPHVASTLDELGRLFLRLGRLEEARPLIERALRIRRASLGDDHPRTGRSLRHLALLARAEGGAEEALRLLQESLAIEERSRGAASPESADGLFALAGLQLDEGQQLAALRTAERALELQRERLGVRHPDVGRSLHRLGAILLAGGELEEARARLDEALVILRGVLGRDHPDAIACVVSLAGVLEEQDELAAAILLHEDVLALRMERLGPGHVRTLESRAALGRLYANAERFAEAREQYLALLAAQEAAGVAVQHAALQETRAGLAGALEELGLHDEAARLRETLQQGYELTPIVTVLSPATSPASVEERRVVIDALIVDPTGVKEVQLEQDGEVVAASSLPGALELDEDGRRARLRWSVRVPPETNETYTSLVAINRRGVTSDPERRLIRFEPKTRALWVLGFGVADYEDDAFDLAYATKDVEDLVARLVEEQERFYDEVFILKLLDEEVTPGALRRARNQFLRKAKPQDTVVVFAAGHGARTEDDEYFFLTTSCTPADPYDGIDRATLESLVTWKHLHAARRVLLIDTCHSGQGLSGTRGETRGIAAFDQVEVDVAIDRSRSGLYILAASADDGFAREREGNGLFTRALLDGMAGAADANENGVIEIEELKEYAARTVHEASGGRQRPTVPTVRGGENFALVRVK